MNTQLYFLLLQRFPVPVITRLISLRLEKTARNTPKQKYSLRSSTDRSVFRHTPQTAKFSCLLLCTHDLSKECQSWGYFLA